jgi:UDP-N-acetylmuramoyl-tripeptide--D-alanyl-D-alanine ligase
VIGSLADAARLAGGRLIGVADPSALISGPVVADSRRVESGSLFVAVSGDRVDGHDYADAALTAGALAVLASRPVGGASLLVDDPVLGLGRLAHGYLEQLRADGGPLVASITGSSGKTSTKDLLAQVLGTSGPTVAPEGSFNTEVGLPLTVLRADSETRFLVLEASSRGIGHIAYLCGVARPDIAVVLNVGTAHLGEFGSRGAVAVAKGELVESLESDGVAVLSADDPLVAAMASRTRGRVVTFGFGSDADVRATKIVLDSAARASFTLAANGNTAPVSLALHGSHHVSNALAVAAVTLEAGLPLEQIATALSGARPLSRWRMEVTARADGVTIINDAYNANPESMRAALAALAASEVGLGGRRWAVLGRMAELGAEAIPAHEELGTEAAAADRLVIVGPESDPDLAAVARGAVRAGLTVDRIQLAADATAAAGFVSDGLAPGDVVLIKASRSADLQRVADALLGSVTPPAAHAAPHGTPA